MSSGLSLYSCCSSVNKVCPKVSEPKRAPEGVPFSVKLDVIKHFDCGEINTFCVH